MSRSVKQFIVILLCLAWCIAIQPASNVSYASPLGECVIQGRVTTQFGHEVVPVRWARVYLFTLEQSKSLQALQRKASERRDEEHLSHGDMFEMMAAYLGSAADLVPRLARTAMVKADGKGFYRFGQVPAGRRYQVVAVAHAEDGLTFVQLVTPVLEAGETLHLDLNDTDDNDWTDLTPVPRHDQGSSARPQR